MKRLTRLIAETQSNMIEQLYRIAQPYLNYPRDMWNAWLYPMVHIWEPWIVEPTDEMTDRLAGQLVVPSVVVFPVLIDDPPEKKEIKKLEWNLYRESGDRWDLTDTGILSNGVIAVRLSQKVTLYTEDKRRSRTFDLPFDFVVPEGVRLEDVEPEPETPSRYPAESGT